MGCHFLLQGIFLALGPNLGLLHYRQILYHLSYREIHYLLLLCHISTQVFKCQGEGVKIWDLPVVLAYCTVIDNVAFIQHLLPVIVMYMIKNMR